MFTRAGFGTVFALTLLLSQTPASAQGGNAQSTTAIAAELAAIGVPVDGTTVRFEVRAPNDLLLYLSQQNDRFYGRGWFEALWVLMRGFGTPVEATPSEFEVNFNKGVMVTQQAWYLPARKTILLNETFATGGAQQDNALAHELTHAAQDQREGLDDIYSRIGTSFDRKIIARCLTEGEAEAASLLFQLAREGRTIEEVDPATHELTQAEISDGAMLLHYGLGRDFMMRRFREGGWKAVRGSLAKPPATTEQLMHGAKLMKDAPVDVPAVELELGEAELRHEDTFGELGIYMLLSVVAVPRTEGFPAAIGWDGDLLRVWRFKTGDYSFHWRTVWDRDQDAEQFERCLTNRVQGVVRRHGRGVDWVWSSLEGVARRHATALEKSPFPASGSEEDAASTELVEREWLSRQPRVEGNVQAFPDLGLRLPIPAGWSESEFAGRRALFRNDDAAVSFRDNLIVTEFVLPEELQLAEVLDLVRATFESSPQFSLIKFDQVEISGTPCLWLEYGQDSPGQALHFLEVQFLRGPKKIAVAATVAEERWKSVGPAVEEALSALEISTDGR